MIKSKNRHSTRCSSAAAHKTKRSDNTIRTTVVSHTENTAAP